MVNKPDFFSGDAQRAGGAVTPRSQLVLETSGLPHLPPTSTAAAEQPGKGSES